MAKIYLQQVKERVRILRNQGWSLGEISCKMKIPKNTLSGWLKGIILTEKQRKRIKQKEVDSAAIGRKIASRLLVEKMEKWKDGIRARVRNLGDFAFCKPEIGKIICGVMYLCEGSKYPSTRCLIFSNSDPVIISCFLNLLRRYFDIKEDKFRCSVMACWDQDTIRLNKFWAKLTKIPLNRFYKITPDKRTKGKPTLKPNYK